MPAIAPAVTPSNKATIFPVTYALYGVLLYRLMLENQERARLIDYNLLL